MFEKSFMNSIKDYYKEHEDEFFDVLEQMNFYNGYLNDENIYPMEEIDYLLEGEKASDILLRVYYGYDGEYGPGTEFDPTARYFSFNGIGNLISWETKDYYWTFLDDDFVETLVDIQNHLSLSDKVMDMLESLEEEHDE